MVLRRKQLESIGGGGSLEKEKKKDAKLIMHVLGP